MHLDPGFCVFHMLFSLRVGHGDQVYICRSEVMPQVLDISAESSEKPYRESPVLVLLSRGSCAARSPFVSTLMAPRPSCKRGRGTAGLYFAGLGFRV